MSQWIGPSQIVLPIMQCLLFAGTAAAGDFVEDKIEKSFQVVPGGRLKVDADKGSIEIRTAASNAIDVAIDRKVKTKDRGLAEEILQDFEIAFEQDDRGVEITAKYKNDGRRRDEDRNRLQVHFTITIPQVYNVDLRTSGGGITVADVEGEVRSQTSGGGLRFGKINGPVWGRTSGGGIKLEEAQGNVDVQTSGGSITIGSVDGEVEAKTSGGSIHIVRSKGSVAARTSGGSITVEEVMGQIMAKTSGASIKAYISRQPEGDCILETSGGSVTVHLVEEIAVDVDARTSGGHVSTDFPFSIVTHRLIDTRLVSE